MNLNKRIEYVVERDDLDGRYDINVVDYPDLWWAKYQRDLDYYLVDPVPVMPPEWDGHQRLLDDDYWPPRDDAPEWAQAEDDDWNPGDIEVDHYLTPAHRSLIEGHMAEADADGDTSAGQSQGEAGA